MQLKKRNRRLVKRALALGHAYADSRRPSDRYGYRRPRGSR